MKVHSTFRRGQVATILGLIAMFNPGFAAAANHGKQLSSRSAARTASAATTTMKIISANQSVAINKCSSAVTVEAQDDGGNVAPVPSNTTIYFTGSDSSLSFYSDSACADSVDTVEMASGQSEVKFYFKGSSTGSRKIIVATYDYNDGNQTETLTSGASPSPSPSPSHSVSPSPSPSPSSSTPVGFGLTLDGVDGETASQVAPIQTMVRALPKKPWIRIVIDTDGNSSDMATSSYSAAYSSLSPYSNIMWELCDSDYVKAASQSEIATVTSNFLAAFPSSSLWEVGNELNGEWLGGQPYTSAVGTANPPVAKAYAAWKLVSGAGKQSALTLYYEPSQTVTAGYDMVTWAQKNFAGLRDMANGLNYVLVSYYEVDNDNVRPTLAEWTTIFESLHSIFPNAKLGFGEVGMDNAVTSSTLSQAEGIMSYYYGLRPSVPGWFGGWFWWYGQEDLVPDTQPMFTQFKTEMGN